MTTKSALTGGRAWKFGDNVDTDVIIPGRYLTTSDPIELARHCMEDTGADFATQVQTADVMVCGGNFGCGSSREHAPLSIKGTGVAAVIAESFARIFFRNAINIGLPILECPAASAGIKAGDRVAIDLDAGRVTNLTTNESFQASPYPDTLLRIIAAGGLIAATREKLGVAAQLRPVTTPK